MSRICLGIDPQSSFTNSIQSLNDGELYVEGADKDMERFGEVVGTVDFDDVIITLDSHEFLHISHPIWFKFADKKEVSHPEPFTKMCIEDGEIVGYVMGKCVGRFVTTIESLQGWTVNYIQTLESKGKAHIIWPTHCLMGTPGHRISPAFMKGVLAWERKKILAGFRAKAQKIMKGMCIYTEFHSAIRPAMEGPLGLEDTKINVELLNYLSDDTVEEITVGGEAMNICVLDSVVDIIKLAGDANEQSARRMAQKIILLTDAMSEVPNCGDIGEKFIEEMTGLGMRTATCAEYIEMSVAW